MGHVKVSGIVLKEINTGEADKVVVVFTRELGRISVYAKGARKSRSRFIAGTGFLCYSSFVLFAGKDMYRLNSCDVLEPFYEIRNDIYRLTFSAHITDLISDTIQENQPSSGVLQLFLNSLHMLAKTDKNPLLITRIFELRLLTILGYAPHAGGCLECGKESLDSMLFSFEKCGFVCSDCASGSRSEIALSAGAAKAVCHIVYSEMDSLFGFNVSDSVLEELGRVTGRYLRERLERNYTKLDFLKTLG